MFDTGYRMLGAGARGWSREMIWDGRWEGGSGLWTHVHLWWIHVAAAAAKSLQSCPTQCDPTDGSPWGSPVPGILQARILEWVAISFSRGSPQPRDRIQVSRLQADALSSEPPGKLLVAKKPKSHVFHEVEIKLVFFFFNFYYYFILLYNTVLVLPYINMNPPRYRRVPHLETPSHLPPHTIPLCHPSAPALSILYHASNLDWWSISHMILYMFQCHSPESSYPHPLAIKKNTFESVLMRWMKLEPIIQSEVSQKEKHQFSILTHIYGI